MYRKNTYNQCIIMISIESKYKNIYAFPKMTSILTHGHQCHIIWKSFNKFLEILVQYQKLNNDDIHHRSPSKKGDILLFTKFDYKIGNCNKLAAHIEVPLQ
jgi:hypothetical protein